MRFFTMTLACAAAVLATTGSASERSSTAKPSSPVQTEKHFKAKDSRTIELNYLLFLPKGYEADSKQRWPLMLFLHGAGERGTDLQKVTVHGPPKIVKSNPEFPFIVVSPQCPEGRIWSSDELLKLLDDVTRKYRVDATRVYLTGLSMGGYGTWDLGLKYPERFAAIAPICGGGEWISVLLATDSKRQALRSLGIWVFHGAKDNVVPLNESERMVEAVKRAGATDVKLTVYPEAGHDAWSETYSNPEFYRWLLRHHQ